MQNIQAVKIAYTDQLINRMGGPALPAINLYRGFRKSLYDSQTLFVKITMN